MNPELLLAHFNRISDAPDAIPRLRRFILSLAVRGKLVEQHPTDEPVSELLKSLHAERDRLVKEKQIKAYRELPPIKRKDAPFSIPSGWQWRRFIEVAAIQSNLVNPSKYEALPHIAPDNIESETGRLLPYTTVGASAVFSAKHLFFAGCILYSKIRPALAKATMVDFDGLCSADMYPILPFINREYLHKYMLSEAFVHQSVSEDNRVAMPKINQVSLSKIVVPVPPLAEQHRIGTKVDELMALCDRLGLARIERESRLDRLTAASHHHLNNGADGDALRKHARFFIGHLPPLTTRPDQIKQLRQTILNLAIRGKLVPQQPHDEPASELLRRIRLEEQRLVEEGAIKRQKTHGPLSRDDTPFGLPPQWEWVRLSTITDVQDPNPSHRMPHYVHSGGVPFISSENFVEGDQINFQIGKRVAQQTLNEQIARFSILSGALAFSRIGTIGKSRFLPMPRTYAISHAVCVINPIDQSSLSMQFLRATLAVEAILALAHRGTRSIGVPDLGMAVIRSMAIPLPPLAEQYRIVAKVDELIRLCDQLEAQLTSAQTDTSRLLEAVLHDALSAGSAHLDPVSVA